MQARLPRPGTCDLRVRGAYVRFESLNHYGLVRAKPRASKRRVPRPTVAYHVMQASSGSPSGSSIQEMGRHSLPAVEHVEPPALDILERVGGPGLGCGLARQLRSRLRSRNLLCVPGQREGVSPTRTGGYLLFTRMRVTSSRQRPPGYAHQTTDFRLSHSERYGTYYLNAS